MTPADLLGAAGIVTEIVKLVKENAGAAEELYDYIHGDGPRPALLDAPGVPDLTRNVLAAARAHARAEGRGGAA